MRQLLEDREIKLLGAFSRVPDWFLEVLRYITEKHRPKPTECRWSTATGQKLIEYLNRMYRGGSKNIKTEPFNKHFKLWLYVILFSTHPGATALREALKEPNENNI